MLTPEQLGEFFEAKSDPEYIAQQESDEQKAAEFERQRFISEMLSRPPEMHTCCGQVGTYHMNDHGIIVCSVCEW